MRQNVPSVDLFSGVRGQVGPVKGWTIRLINGNIMSTVLRFSQLSTSRQALIRVCQAINHGSIEDLEVRHSEPVFDPWPVTLRDVKLDSDEGPRPELALRDFVVSDEVLRLMNLLDEIKCGTVRRVEVHAGVPRRILLESQILGREARPLQAEGPNEH